MQRKPEPKITELLAMPATKGMDDIEFDKIEFKTFNEERIAEVIRSLTDNTSKSTDSR